MAVFITMGQVVSSSQRYATGIPNGEGFGVDAASHRIFLTQQGRDPLHVNWPDLYPPNQEPTVPAGGPEPIGGGAGVRGRWRQGSGALCHEARAGSVDCIAATITQGVAQPTQFRALMPAMGGAMLTPDQVKAMAAYVWRLSHRATR